MPKSLKEESTKIICLQVKKKNLHAISMQTFSMLSSDSSRLDILNC